MRTFVLKAQATYASGTVPIDAAPDGRRTLIVESDAYIVTDEFDGGNPFCGIERLIQKVDGKAAWNGYYHGWLTPEAKEQGFSVEVIFNFLRQALQRPSPSTIFRGPGMYQDKILRYSNTHEHGDFVGFYGFEQIVGIASGKSLYYARYGGGLVNLVEDTGEAGAL